MYGLVFLVLAPLVKYSESEDYFRSSFEGYKVIGIKAFIHFKLDEWLGDRLSTPKYIR